MFSKIDIHTHILPPTLPCFKSRFGYGGFIQHHKENHCSHLYYDDGTFFRTVQPNCYLSQTRVEDVIEKQKCRQVLSVLPVLFYYWAKPQDTLETSRYFNDFIAEVCALYPQLFLGLATLPMQDTDLAIKELERALNKLKLHGIILGTNINGEELDSQRLFPFWKYVEEKQVSVFIHPWNMLGKERLKQFWTPWLLGMPTETALCICHLIFGKVLDHFPNLKIAFAHGGGNIAFNTGRIERGVAMRKDLFPQIRYPFRNYLKKIWVDTLVHDPQALKLLIHLFGTDNLVLGSDYPFPLGEDPCGKALESLNLSSYEKDKIYQKNAQRWLGLCNTV